MSVTITNLPSVQSEGFTRIAYIASTYYSYSQIQWNTALVCHISIYEHNARNCTPTIVVAITVIISTARFPSAAWLSQCLMQSHGARNRYTHVRTRVRKSTNACATNYRSRLYEQFSPNLIPGIDTDVIKPEASVHEGWETDKQGR